MSEAVKVSVIIPVYNTELYLRECIGSIINQTLREIEIICIDDGSTDGCLTILNDYGSTDDRIRVVTQENKGLSAVRNAGIDIASGKYTYFIDSDDMLKADALKELYELAEKESLDVVYFDSSIIYESEEIPAQKRIPETFYIRKHDYSKVTNGADMFTAMMERDEFRCSACLQFIKAEYMKTHSLRFREGILHEDELFTFLCMIQANRVIHINKPFYIRRMRFDSIMTNKRGFQNFYGLLVCFIHMTSFSIQCEYPKKVQEQVNKRLEAVRNNAISVYIENGKPESWLDRLSITEQYFGRFFILQVEDSDSLRRQIEELDRKIADIHNSRAWKIGTKLQKVYRFFIP